MDAEVVYLGEAIGKLGVLETEVSETEQRDHVAVGGLFSVEVGQVLGEAAHLCGAAELSVAIEPLLERLLGEAAVSADWVGAKLAHYSKFKLFES